jgi:hypothetical protein
LFACRRRGRNRFNASRFDHDIVEGASQERNVLADKPRNASAVQDLLGLQPARLRAG